MINFNIICECVVNLRACWWWWTDGQEIERKVWVRVLLMKEKQTNQVASCNSYIYKRSSVYSFTVIWETKNANTQHHDYRSIGAPQFSFKTTLYFVKIQFLMQSSLYHQIAIFPIDEPWGLAIKGSMYSVNGTHVINQNTITRTLHMCLGLYDREDSGRVFGDCFLDFHGRSTAQILTVVTSHTHAIS